MCNLYVDFGRSVHGSWQFHRTLGVFGWSLRRCPHKNMLRDEKLAESGFTACHVDLANITGPATITCCLAASVKVGRIAGSQQSMDLLSKSLY